MSRLRMSDLPMTWVFAGDSITQGVFHTHGSRSWVEHVHERLRWQLGRLRDAVINTGMSGWTAREVLGEFDHLIRRFDPDVVSLSLGMNDVLEGPQGRRVFRDALQQLVERSGGLGAQVVLHTPNLASREALPGRADLAAYVDVVRELASQEGAVLVDHNADWVEHFGRAEPTGWLDDPVHPNASGHQRMADLTLETLGLGPLADRP